jgi:F0F1-type ATP synthase assembly protein I
VNGVAPVLAAGGTFAAMTLAGLLVGVWLGRAAGQPLWVIGGLFVGLLLGGYCAFRLLMRSI